MAGVGPYGIEQVDVPGILGNAQNMQFNRVRMMMAQKQLEMQDLMMNRQKGAMQALNAYYASQGGASDASANSSGSSTSSGASGAVNAYGTPATSSAPVMPHADDVVAQPAPVQPSQPAGPYDANGVPTTAELANRQRVLAGLNISGNSELADQFLKGFSSMDAMQQQAFQARNAQAVRVGAGILQLPYAQRKAAIMADPAPFLAVGYDQQHLANFDPTDGNVRKWISDHSDMDHIMSMVSPHFESERPGGAIVETQPYDTTRTVAESPIIESGGLAYPRPQSLSQMPHQPTATGKNGEKYQLNPQTNQWEIIGGPTPPASGNF